MGQDPKTGAAAFSVSGGKTKDLAGLDGSASGFADGINNLGDIVGTSDGSAVLWLGAASTSAVAHDKEVQPITSTERSPRAVAGT